VLTVEIVSENVTEVFTGFGQRGVSAEQVAGGVAREVSEYLASEAPVGPHLADQLLVPLALAGGGSFCTVAPTRHTETNVEVVRAFTGARVSVARETPDRWRIDLETAGDRRGEA
jgi:RNA 3'-terminal phosphate cyclase (ATP)